MLSRERTLRSDFQEIAADLETFSERHGTVVFEFIKLITELHGGFRMIQAYWKYNGNGDI